MRFVLLLLAFAGTALAGDLAPVRDWIARQNTIKSIASDFTQTRTLRTLRDPVVAHGKFWFRAPGSFRWQVGDPPKLLVLGDDREVLTIQPTKQTAERTATARNFDFLQFPFAADFAAFQKRFEVLSVRTADGRCHLEILPREAQSRRFLEKIALDFDLASGRLLGFEVLTREGSALRTEFTNTRVNVSIDPAVFRFDLTGYRVRDGK